MDMRLRVMCAEAYPVRGEARALTLQRSVQSVSPVEVRVRLFFSLLVWVVSAGCERQ